MKWSAIAVGMIAVLMHPADAGLLKNLKQAPPATKDIQLDSDIVPVWSDLGTNAKTRKIRLKRVYKYWSKLETRDKKAIKALYPTMIQDAIAVKKVDDFYDGAKKCLRKQKENELKNRAAIEKGLSEIAACIKNEVTPPTFTVLASVNLPGDYHDVGGADFDDDDQEDEPLDADISTPAMTPAAPVREPERVEIQPEIQPQPEVRPTLDEVKVEEPIPQITERQEERKPEPSVEVDQGYHAQPEPPRQETYSAPVVEEAPKAVEVEPVPFVSERQEEHTHELQPISEGYITDSGYQREPEQPRQETYSAPVQEETPVEERQEQRQEQRQEERQEEHQEKHEQEAQPPIDEGYVNDNGYQGEPEPLIAQPPQEETYSAPIEEQRQEERQEEHEQEAQPPIDEGYVNDNGYQGEPEPLIAQPPQEETYSAPIEEQRQEERQEEHEQEPQPPIDEGYVNDNGYQGEPEPLIAQPPQEETYPTPVEEISPVQEGEPAPRSEEIMDGGVINPSAVEDEAPVETGETSPLEDYLASPSYPLDPNSWPFSPTTQDVPPLWALDLDHSNSVVGDEWAAYLRRLHGMATHIATTGRDPVAVQLLDEIIDFHYGILGQCITQKLRAIGGGLELQDPDYETVAQWIEDNCYVKFRYSLFAGVPPFEWIAKDEPAVPAAEIEKWFALQVETARVDLQVKHIISLAPEHQELVEKFIGCTYATLKDAGDAMVDRDTYYGALRQIEACSKQ